MKKEEKWSTNKLKMSDSINKFCGEIREKDLKITNLKKEVKLNRMRIHEFKTELKEISRTYSQNNLDEIKRANSKLANSYEYKDTR